MKRATTSPTINFSFETLDGRFEISERGKQEPSGIYQSTDLVKRDINNVTLDVYYDAENNDKCQIEIKAFHVIDQKSDRAFHSVIKADLDWHQVEQMRDFFNLLLTLR